MIKKQYKRREDVSRVLEWKLVLSCCHEAQTDLLEREGTTA